MRGMEGRGSVGVPRGAEIRGVFMLGRFCRGPGWGGGGGVGPPPQKGPRANPLPRPLLRPANPPRGGPPLRAPPFPFGNMLSAAPVPLLGVGWFSAGNCRRKKGSYQVPGRYGVPSIITRSSMVRAVIFHPQTPPRHPRLRLARRSRNSTTIGSVKFDRDRQAHARGAEMERKDFEVARPDYGFKYRHHT